MRGADGWSNSSARLAGVAFALLMALASSGCTTPPRDKSGVNYAPPTVFGRIHAMRDGDPQSLAGMTMAGWFRCIAFVYSESDDAGRALALDPDGWFDWPLAPGDYVFSNLYCSHGNTTYQLPLHLRFTLERGAPVTYIGDLWFNLTSRRFEDVRWDSQFADAGAEFARRFPSRPQPVERIAVFDGGPGSLSYVRSICAPKWQIDCGRTLQGLEPVAPPIDRGMNGLGFAPVASVTPTLKWKPAPVKARYDVVIWEAVRFQAAIGERRTVYEPGRVVAYAEGLEEPEFTVTDALKPGTKYFWSIRLREAGEVSSWSRGGHLTFLVFYTSSSSGQWFGFETPGETRR